MRLVLLCTTTTLAGCIGFSIEPGSLGCDPAASPACPKGWQCVTASPFEALGRCHPPAGSGPGDDPLVVGPQGAPVFDPAGRTFYLDPASGKASNPGTAQAPWPSLAQVVAAKKIERRDASGAVVEAGEARGGDTLLLRDGDHGVVDLGGYFNDTTINVVADPGATPKLGGLALAKGRGWWLQGLQVVGDCAGANAIVQLGGGGGATSDIRLIGNRVAVAEDRASWSEQQWRDIKCRGIAVDDAQDVRVAFNDVRTVESGITVHHTKRVTVARNRIDGYTANGIDLRGDGSSELDVSGNLVVNSLALAAATAMIRVQYCAGCRDIAMRGNRLLRLVGSELTRAQVPSIQGMIFYSSSIERLTIVNNLVVGDHWHGITVENATDVSIINNTAVGAYGVAKGDGPTHSWIRVTSPQPQTVVVRNNLTNELDVEAAAVVDHNAIADKPDALFVDWRANDFRLRQGSPAVDQGSADQAPPTDLAGNARGTPPDLGAYEQVDSTDR